MEEREPCSVIPISWPFLRHLESHFQYQPSLACTPSWSSAQLQLVKFVCFANQKPDSGDLDVQHE